MKHPPFLIIGEVRKISTLTGFRDTASCKFFALQLVRMHIHVFALTLCVITLHGKFALSYLVLTELHTFSAFNIRSKDLHILHLVRKPVLSIALGHFTVQFTAEEMLAVLVNDPEKKKEKLQKLSPFPTTMHLEF